MVKTSQFLVDVLWFSLIFTQIHWTKLGGAFLPASGCIVVISPLNPTNVLSLPWLCPWNLMNTPTAPTTPHWSPSHVYRWWPQATRICSSSHRWTTWGQKRSNCWNTTTPVGSAGVIWGFEGNLTDVLYNIWTYKIYIRVCALYIYNRYTLWMCSRYADTINMFFAQPIHVQLVLCGVGQHSAWMSLRALNWDQQESNDLVECLDCMESTQNLLSLFHHFHFYSSLLVQLQRKLDQWNLAWSPCNSAETKPKLQAAPTRHDISTCAPWHWKRSTLEPGRGREEADSASMAWFEASSGCQHGGFTMIYMFLKFTCS